MCPPCASWSWEWNLSGICKHTIALLQTLTCTWRCWSACEAQGTHDKGSCVTAVVLHSPGMSLDCTAQPRSSLITVLCVIADLPTVRDPKTVFLADVRNSRVVTSTVTFENADYFTQFLTL